MTEAQLISLLRELLSLPKETEWVEFKHNNDDPHEIGRHVSALSNSAALHCRKIAYLVWGIEDGSQNVRGTVFRPRLAKKGNEELENWLMRSLNPQVDLRFHEFECEASPIVLLEIPQATHAPVAFQGEEFIRVGSYTKKLKDYPTKESALWASFVEMPFEKGAANRNVPGDQVLALLDFSICFDLLKIPLPTDHAGILKKLADECLIVPKPGGVFDIANLGAILFAKDLRQFGRLARKALRIIKYTGSGPMVEIFADRMEITNPGEPLVELLRFVDTPPRSRNEDLAALMRRMDICEEPWERN
jgi:ATP-dependent DNA helicase RecG